ncbi:hypothetical protein V8F20_006208 [Naviculisporaceae sp. PSN 640]
MSDREVTGLHSLAPELLCQIFESCDTFEQVSNLASASRGLYAVWNTHQSAILTAVLERCVPGFDEALVAARVTAFVTNLLKEGTLPPKSGNIDIASFSAKACRVRTSDIAPVLQLHDLAEIMERQSQPFLNKYYGYPPDYPASPEQKQHMRLSFHRAVYRVLLAGPVLVGWYLEPFSADNTTTFNIPYALSRINIDRTRAVPYYVDNPYQGLERYLAYDQVANVTLDPRLDDIFGSLSSWLISSIKNHLALSDIQWAQEMTGFLESSQFHATGVGLLGAAGTNKHEVAAILREVMNMMLAFDALRYWKRKDVTVLESWSEIRRIYTGPAKFDKANIIVMGDYRPLEYVICRTQGYQTNVVAIFPIACGQDRGEGVTLHSLQSFISAIGLIRGMQFMDSGRINRINGDFGPLPEFQFFAFILNRYFNLQCAYPRAPDPLERMEVFRPAVQALCGNWKLRPLWLGLLKPTPENPVYTYSMH